MGTEPVLKPAGMYTDPNPLSAVPRGALREALNVVIRRDGVVQPRPGFGLQGLDETLNGTAYRMLPWQDAILYTTSVGSWMVDPSTGEVLTPSGPIGDLAFGAPGSGFAHRSVDTRRNLYLTAANGVVKLTSTTDAQAHKVGVNGRRQTMSLSLQGSAGWFTTAFTVAYRLVIQRRDDNEVIVTSSPTGRYIIANASGGDRTVQAIVGLADTGPDEDVGEGDEIILYRSEMAASSPSDDLFLAMRHVVTAADLVAGTITLQDVTPQNDLGAALYTNDDQEGANQANDPPPRVQDLQLFRGSVFGADIDGPRRVIIKFSAITNNTRTGVADGVGFRQFLGDTTNGSPDITNVTTTVGVEVGSMISMVGIPSGALVTAVVPATSITVDIDATVTDTGVAGIAYDTITFQDDGTFAIDTPVNFASRVNRGSILSTKGIGVPSTYYRASVLSDFNTASSGTEQLSSVLIEEIRPNTGAIFALTATHGADYDPDITQYGASAATTDDPYVDAYDIPNGLIWSKTDQPEAFPGTAAGNILRVGSSSFRIDRILATRDALWIFKRDGIFRLTGNGAGPPASWRVDPFDMTHFLVATDSAIVMGEAIYAWTNRGVVRIADSGITQISALAIGNELGEIERIAGETQINSYESTTLATGWAYGDLKNDEYVFAAPALDDGNLSALPEFFYVYNTKTLAWTRWTFRHDVRHGAVTQDTCLAVLMSQSPGGAGTLSAWANALTLPAASWSRPGFAVAANGTAGLACGSSGLIAKAPALPGAWSNADISATLQGTNVNLTSAAFGATALVALVVGANGEGYPSIARTANGMTSWLAPSTDLTGIAASNVGFHGVCWTADRFVALIDDGLGVYTALVSLDGGDTFSGFVGPTVAGGLNQLFYDATSDRVIAVTGVGFYISTDRGATWGSLITMPGTGVTAPLSVARLGSTLWAVGGNDAAGTPVAAVWSSANNGTSWTLGAATGIEATTFLFNVIEVNGTLVAGASNQPGDAAALYTSGDGLAWVPQPDSIGLVGASASAVLGIGAGGPGIYGISSKEFVFGATLSVGATAALDRERTSKDGATSYDREYTGAMTVVTEDGVSAVTLDSEITGYTPTAGDLAIDDDDAIARVVAPNGATEFTASDALEDGPVTLRESFPCSIEFVAKIDGNAAAEKAWRDGSVNFGSVRLMERYALTFTSSLIAAAVSTEQLADEWPDNDNDTPWVPRFWVPRNHARSGVLFPRIDIAQAGSDWQVYGLTLTGIAQSSQVRR